MTFSNSQCLLVQFCFFIGSRGRTSESELKPPQPLKPLQPLKPPQPLASKKPGNSSHSDRKREPSSPLTPLGAAKKPKLSSPTYPPHSLRVGDGESGKRPGNSSQSSSHSQVQPIEGVLVCIHVAGGIFELVGAMVASLCFGQE